MDLDKVVAVVDGIPHMRPAAGKRVYDHVIKHRLRRVLELGCYHGVSTCYLAAAVHEIGGGAVTTIDRRSSRHLQPNVEELVATLGLADLVTPVFAHRSLTWELRRLLSEDPRPQFDFVFLDAGHTWDVTGFAFFLSDLLLRPGGWMLFDDLNWSVATSPSVSDATWAMEMSEEERSDQQVRSVFELLVQTDARYETSQQGNWGWARKREDAQDIAQPRQPRLLARTRKR